MLTAPGRPKTPAMMRAMGRAVERLGGRYITAEDVGSSVADMDEVASATAHVAGRDGDGGDPSPFTARGVFLCLEAAVRHRLGRDLPGVHVAVKGLGHVGFALAGFLHAAGARLTVAGHRRRRGWRGRGKRSAPPRSPVQADRRGRGGRLRALRPRRRPLRRRRSRASGAGIVCGAANNQLATPEDGMRLARRGVLYCPDYLVNAGGVISVARAAARADGRRRSRRKLAALPATLIEVLRQRRARRARARASSPTGIARARFRPQAAQRLSA